MSLIQEALKRQHEDVSKDKGGGTAAPQSAPAAPAQAAAPPVMPPPLPVARPGTTPVPTDTPSSLKLKAPRAAEAETPAAGADGKTPIPLGQVVEVAGDAAAKKKKQLKIVAAVLIFILSGVAGYVAVSMLLKKPAAPPPTAPGETSQSGTGVATQSLTNTQSPSTGVSTGATVVTPVIGTNDGGVQPPPEQTPGDQTKPPLVKREPVIWPILTVQGVMGSTSRRPRGAAIINSDIIAIGTEIEGVRLISVDSDSATFSFKDETKKVKVGGNTAQ